MNARADRNESAGVDPRALKEAARWLTQFHAGDMDEAGHLAWQRWKDASPEHLRAWLKAEQLLGKLRIIPPELGHTLNRPAVLGRRQALKAIVAAASIAPAAWFGYRLFEEKAGWVYAADVGQRRDLSLPDGSALALNTDSRVRVDFNEHTRKLSLLRGEMLLDTRRALADTRELTVSTDDGWLRLNDARVNLRRRDAGTELSVLRGAVELVVMRPLAETAAPMRIEAGRQALFHKGRLLGEHAGDDEAGAWTNGVIYADNMRLAAFLEELGRYREGVLVCDPAVADLRISGVFRTADTTQLLTTLQNTLPVRVSFRTRYWVTVSADSAAATRT